jgi:hypothetical protein
MCFIYILAGGGGGDDGGGFVRRPGPAETYRSCTYIRTYRKV